MLLVSTVQQSKSIIYIYMYIYNCTHICVYTSPLFWISFPFRSPQSTEQGSLSYTVGFHLEDVMVIITAAFMEP